MAKKFLASLGLAFILICGPTIHASAHELLPQPIVQYLQNHPDATPEEIQAYARINTPEFAKKIQDRDTLLKIIGKRETNWFDNSIDFLKLGIGHILSGPDHILFVISLILVFVSIKEVLKMTSTFTVAHTITLVLAGTGIFTLPSHIVEPLIAVSIAFVAITSVFLRGKKFFGDNRGKIAMVFFFGLFHGLGFAGLLKEIQIPKNRFVSSLLSFNIGIEIGQLIILALVLPAVYHYRDRPWYPKAIKVVAVLIAGLALFWLGQRVGLL